MLSGPRICFLTQTDERGASARLRVYAYKPYLEREGFRVTIVPANTRPTTGGYLETAWMRLRDLPRATREADVLVLQRDFVNHLAPWIERLYAARGVPMVLDVDDAIDLRPPGHPPTWRTRLLGTPDKLEALSRLVAAVVAGNNYLAEKIRPWNPHVQVVPTCLDLSGRARPAPRSLPRDRPVVIGWIGSPLTTSYLEPVRPALERLAARRPIRLRTVGAAALHWPGVPLDQRPWDAETETAGVESFDIGIMPLSDDEWSRSKCGTKILQYFAAAVPVVASPVGMNVFALDGGRAGLLASGEDGWFSALERLSTDAALYRALSASGRERVEAEFDVRRYAPVWASLLSKLSGGS